MKFTISSTDVILTPADRAALMSAVRQRLRRGQGFALATINLDHLVKLRLNDGFRRAYAGHDLVVADGNPIVWLSRLAGRRVPLITGSDLVLPLAHAAATEDVAVALVGSTPGTLALAAARLEEMVPGLSVTERIAPAFGFDPDGEAATEILTQLAAGDAGLCFLALGAPKQEILAARGRQIAPHIGFVSVGAGLDFIAGRQMRAPLWVRHLALEWVWRALTSPRRLIPRYLACLAILPGQAWRALRLRFTA